MVHSLPWERLRALEAGGDVNLSKSYGAKSVQPFGRKYVRKLVMNLTAKQGNYQ